MRLRRLQLLAFGSFTDTVLDFGEEAGRMHVVYGPNEAGKSTALRAITALFYGVPTRTADAHVHEMKRLRVGAVLEHGDGEVLEILRRKGRKHTILDRDDKPIDEARLSRALCGVSRSLFATMFGLDHVSLREGAQALLRGDGDVGESLFDAGGARGIGKVLDALRDEADELYRPRGQTPKLNDALRRLKDAKQKILLKEMLPSAWTAQKEATESARAEHEVLTLERQRLGAELSRVQRGLRAFPHLSRRRQIMQRLEALAAIPRLASDARDRRLAAQHERDLGSRRASQLEEEIAAMREERDGLAFDPGLAELGEGVVRDINDRLGNHRKAQVDLPKREAAWRARRSEVDELLRELGGDTSLEQVTTMRMDKPARARLDALRNAHGRLEAELESASEAREATAAKREALLARLQSLREPADIGVLRGAVSRAQRDGDLGAELTETERNERELRSRCAALEVDIRGASALPRRSAVEEARAALDGLAERRATLAAARRDLADRFHEVETDLEELANLGAPSTEELAASRRRRDALWTKLAGNLAKASADDVSAFEDAAAECDHLADRLWREADRVAKHARLTAEKAAHERGAGDLDARERALDEERDAAQRVWRELWRGLEGEAPTAAEAVSLLDSGDELESVREQLALCESEAAAMRRRLDGHRERLAVWVGEDGRLRDWLDRAEARLEEEEELRHQRRVLEDKAAELDEELAVLDRRQRSKVAAMEEWRAGWRDAVSRLGLGEEATVDEVTAVEGVLNDLFARLRDAEELERRIEGMRRDAEEFREMVAPLVERHATALVSEPLDRAAEGLVKLHQSSVAAEAHRAGLAERIAAKREQLIEVRERHELAEQTLAELMRQGGVEDEAKLEAIEQQAEERHQLEQRLLEAEEALFSEGSIDELEELTRDLNIDETRARLAELEEEHRDVIEACERLSATIGASQRGLEELESKEGAVVAAAAREETLATIRRHAARYARVRLAAFLLESEIERYRQHHQGPILARAGELFPRLTLGRYRALSVGYDEQDEPALRCTRSDGIEVDVAGLSDGTRDQLYLALRLASLERYAERSELLPFVVDDVLIHFDDERARAALEVLAEFADKTQVLFFTHHRRLVELAEGLAHERVRHHRLPDPKLPR